MHRGSRFAPLPFDEGALALHITERGLAVIGVERDGGKASVAEAPDQETASKSSPSPRRAAAARKQTEATQQKSAEAGPGESKQAAVIAMLQGGRVRPAAIAVNRAWIDRSPGLAAPLRKTYKKTSNVSSNMTRC